MLRGHILRLGKNSLIYGIGNMLTKMLSLLLLPFLTSYLSPDEYGVISIFNTFSVFLQAFFQLGIGAGLAPVYFEKEAQKERDEVIKAAYIILVVSSFIMIILCLLYRSPLTRFITGQSNYQKAFCVHILTVALSSVEIPLLLKYQFEERAVQFAGITVISTLLCYLAIFLLVIKFRLGVEGYLYGYLVSEWIRFLMYYSGAKLYNIRQKISGGLIKQQLNVSIPLVPSFFSLYILAQISRIVLQAESGLEAVGIFSVGVSLGSVFSLFTGAVSTAWTPFFLSFDVKNKETKLVLSRITTVYVYVFGFFTLLFFIFAKPVVALMTAKAYLSAYKIVGFAASAQFFLGCFYMLLPPLYYAAKTKEISAIQFPAAIVTAVITVFTIMRYHVVGAAFALMLGYLFLDIFTILWIRLHKDYFQINYECKRIGILSIFLIVMSGTTMFFQSKQKPLAEEWFIALSFALFAGACFWLLCTKEERKTFKRYIKILSKKG